MQILHRISWALSHGAQVAGLKAHQALVRRLAVGGQQPRLAKGKPLTPAFQQRVESHRREEALSIASAFDNATLCELFNQTQHRNVEKARHQLKVLPRLRVKHAWRV